MEAVITRRLDARRDIAVELRRKNETYVMQIVPDSSIKTTPTMDLRAFLPNDDSTASKVLTSNVKIIKLRIEICIRQAV